MIEFGVLVIAAALMSQAADSEAGKTGWTLIGCFLFAAALMTADWGVLL